MGRDGEVLRCLKALRMRGDGSGDWVEHRGGGLLSKAPGVCKDGDGGVGLFDGPRAIRCAARKRPAGADEEVGGGLCFAGEAQEWLVCLRSKAPWRGPRGKGGRDNSALHRDGARAAKARSCLLTLESVAAGSGFDCVRIQTDAAAGVRISRRSPRSSLLTLESVPLRAPPGGKGRLTFFCARQSLRSGTMRRPGVPPVLALTQV